MTPELRELIARQEAGEALSFVFFWGHTPKAPGVVDKACLSNWWPAPFAIDGVRYANTEQHMMAEKARTFDDHDTLAKILAATEPGRVKELGREVKGFLGEPWAARRFDVVVAGNLAKFSQHAELRAFLLGTGDAILVEASPKDAIWGIGLDEHDARAREPRAWKGTNLLGFALMQVRERLRTEAGPKS